MNKKCEANIVVYSKNYLRLPAFFFALFVYHIISTDYDSFKGNSLFGLQLFLSIFFSVLWLGLAIFLFAIRSSKIFVYGNKIIAKKWYGLRTTYYVRDIEKITFEKSRGKIVKVKVVAKNFQGEYVDNKENFDVWVNYLIEKVSPEKISCYIFGSKKETSL